MGEIDTKPIESVQAALTFFEHSIDQRKINPANDQQEGEKESETESLEKALANAKVQLEAKEAAHKHALLKAEHYHKTTDELSTLLKSSDLKKNFYINESREATSRANELEEHLLHAKNELQSTQNELVIIREANAESISQMEGLLKQVSESNEAITGLKREAADALAAKEAELESAAKAVSEAHQKHDLFVRDLENQLQMSAAELNRLREEMKLEEKKSLDQAAYISLLEAEVEQLKSEVIKANEEAHQQNEYAENLKMELEKSKEEENEAKVEIALIKVELHKGRSKQAAAEAAEARAQGEKSALYNALQQMGLEAEEAKRENRMLKEALKSADHPTETISSKDHQEEKEDDDKIEDMKRELEAANSKIGELRTRAEQATSRAEAAEKAKAALEEQNKKRREQKERRKMALAALREESMEREIDRIKIETSAKNYQPLGKVLNMKF